MVVKGGVDEEELLARPEADDEFGTGDDILALESTTDLESNLAESFGIIPSCLDGA